MARAYGGLMKQRLTSGADRIEALIAENARLTAQLAAREDVRGGFVPTHRRGGTGAECQVVTSAQNASNGAGVVVYRKRDGSCWVDGQHVFYGRYCALPPKPAPAPAPAASEREAVLEAENQKLRGLLGPAWVALRELIERIEMVRLQGARLEVMDVTHAKAVHAAMPHLGILPTTEPGLERAKVLEEAAQWHEDQAERATKNVEASRAASRGPAALGWQEEAAFHRFCAAAIRALASAGTGREGGAHG